MVIVDGIGGDEFVKILPLVHDGFVGGKVGLDGFVEEGFKRLHKLFLVTSLIH